MTKKTITWILVADGTRASIYANDGPGLGLYRATEKDLAINSPTKVGDIMSDQQGRAANPAGGGYHSLEPRTDPRRHEESVFLHSVASFLDEAAQSKIYERLVLAAPPKALGDLRSSLSPQTTALVVQELDKDLVNLSERDLEQHLIAADAIQ